MDGAHNLRWGAGGETQRLRFDSREESPCICPVASLQGCKVLLILYLQP